GAAVLGMLCVSQVQNHAESLRRVAVTQTHSPYTENKSFPISYTDCSPPEKKIEQRSTHSK
ncbi:hypothetical protein JTM45_33450, partial [Pseudomonas aeruginosa]|nr:hypothetical protein [Pseudomonas aeruginosa]